MKRIDIIIGILVSAGLHGGVLWGGELIGKAKAHLAQQTQDNQSIVAAEIDFTAPEEAPKPQNSDAKETRRPKSPTPTTVAISPPLPCRNR
jgi:hypothetical protein